MNEKLKALYEKYKDLIPYVIFGVLTTIVNYVSYWLFAHPLGCGTVFSTAVAWVLSVLFAYVTNRRWVFHSEAKGAKAIGKERRISRRAPRHGASGYAHHVPVR